MKKIKETKNNSFTLFGLRFELWEVIEGYRVSVDTKTTRHIFKFFGYIGNCSVVDLI